MKRPDGHARILTGGSPGGGMARRRRLADEDARFAIEGAEDAGGQCGRDRCVAAGGCVAR